MPDNDSHDWLQWPLGKIPLYMFRDEFWNKITSHKIDGIITIYYQFAEQPRPGYGYENDHFTPLRQEQKDIAIKNFRYIESIINVKDKKVQFLPWTQTTSAPGYCIYYANSVLNSKFTYAYTKPATDLRECWIWINSDKALTWTFQPHQLEEHLFHHETLHALGGSHTHLEKNEIRFNNLENMTTRASVMSYITHPDYARGNDYDVSIFPMGLGWVDIASLRARFGVTAVDVLQAPSQTYHWEYRQPILTTLAWKGDLDLSNQDTNQIINLFPMGHPKANYSSVGAHPWGGVGLRNLAIAPDVIINNASTGSGNDIIVGNDFANTLTSGDGDDFLDGQGGDDTLIGGRESNFYVLDSGGQDTVIIADGSKTWIMLNNSKATDYSVQTGPSSTQPNQITFSNSITQINFTLSAEKPNTSVNLNNVFIVDKEKTYQVNFASQGQLHPSYSNFSFNVTVPPLLFMNPNSTNELHAYIDTSNISCTVPLFMQLYIEDDQIEGYSTGTTGFLRHYGRPLPENVIISDVPLSDLKGLMFDAGNGMQDPDTIVQKKVSVRFATPDGWSDWGVMKLRTRAIVSPAVPKNKVPTIECPDFKNITDHVVMLGSLFNLKDEENDYPRQFRVRFSNLGDGNHKFWHAIENREWVPSPEGDTLSFLNFHDIALLPGTKPSMIKMDVAVDDSKNNSYEHWSPTGSVVLKVAKPVSPEKEQQSTTNSLLAVKVNEEVTDFYKGPEGQKNIYHNKGTPLYCKDFLTLFGHQATRVQIFEDPRYSPKLRLALGSQLMEEQINGHVISIKDFQALNIRSTAHIPTNQKEDWDRFGIRIGDDEGHWSDTQTFYINCCYGLDPDFKVDTLVAKPGESINLYDNLPLDDQFSQLLNAGIVSKDQMLVRFIIGHGQPECGNVVYRNQPQQAGKILELPYTEFKQAYFNPGIRDTVLWVKAKFGEFTAGWKKVNVTLVAAKQ